MSFSVETCSQVLGKGTTFSNKFELRVRPQHLTSRRGADSRPCKPLGFPKACAGERPNHLATRTSERLNQSATSGLSSNVVNTAVPACVFEGPNRLAITVRPPNVLTTWPPHCVHPDIRGLTSFINILSESDQKTLDVQPQTQVHHHYNSPGRGR